MKKAILTAVLLLALLWCMGEPADGELDFGWVAGELAGFATILLCARGLRRYYHEK